MGNNKSVLTFSLSVFQLKCENCGEETPEFIYCTLTVSMTMTV